MDKELEYSYKLNFSNTQSVNISNNQVIFNALINKKVTSPCPYYKECGNCNLLNLEYKNQLELKLEFVKQLFKKYSVDVEDIEGLTYPYKYRNKLHLCFSFKNNNLNIGFIKQGTNIVVDIPSCLLHDKWYEVLYSEIKTYIKKSKIQIYNKQTKIGNLKYVVARVIDNSLMLIVVQKSEYYNGLKQLYTNLTKYFKSVCLYINLNTSPTNLVLTDNFKHIAGEKNLFGTICDVKFNLGVKSFYQVNKQITTKIYNQVLSLVRQTDAVNIIDCFSGIGITSCIFAKNGYTVQSVEIVKNACQNAEKNANINNLSIKIEINCSDAIKLINSLSNKTKSVLFVDPARMGLTKDFINNINFNNISAIIYLSCNPKTLLEDVELLTKKYNFSLNYVKPFDMFANTFHTEILTMLKRNNIHKTE